MFSTCTLYQAYEPDMEMIVGVCRGYWSATIDYRAEGVSHIENTQLAKKMLVSDIVIGVALATLAILGNSGVLPLAVGITFSVASSVQLALMIYASSRLISRQKECKTIIDALENHSGGHISTSPRTHGREPGQFQDF